MIAFYYQIKTPVFSVGVDQTLYPLFDNKRLLVMTPKGLAIKSLKETTTNYVRDESPRMLFDSLKGFLTISRMVYCPLYLP